MRARAGVGFAAAVLAMVACARDATADNPPKRDAPDYAGRPAPPPTPGEVLLWVPRVVFFPVYFTSEYLIRRPLGFLVTEAERANIPSVLYDFFAFGPEHKAGIVPTAFVDFGWACSCRTCIATWPSRRPYGSACRRSPAEPCWDFRARCPERPGLPA